MTQYIYIGKFPIWIKKEPDVHSTNIGVIKNSEFVFVDHTTTDGWLVLKKGYVYKYDKDGKSLFENDIVTRARADINRRKTIKERFIAYDGEDDVNKWNYYPSEGEMAKYKEANGNSVSIVNNGNGTWAKITYDEKGQVGEEIYSENGTISNSTYSYNQYGQRDETTVYADGSKTVKTGVERDGYNSKYTRITEYDASGNIVNDVKQPISAANGTGITNDQALALMGEEISTTSYSGRGTNSGNIAMNMTDIYAINGIPYQFMDIADKPVGNFGRIYADRVVARMPLLIICPGEPKFMAGWSDEDRKSVWNQILGQVEAGSTIDNITQRQGRYYVFEETWDTYVQYLAPLCQSAAIFLGIGGEPAPGGNGTLARYRWDNFNNSDIAGKLNYRHSAAFYIHSDTQITDSMGNSTTRSQLADKVNQFSALAKEVQFLTGSLGANINSDKLTGLSNSMSGENSINNLENVEKFTEDVIGKGNFLDRLSANLGTVIQGGKLIFPEIWDDSQFSKEYSITLKLRCPNPDPLSWYFNIWVPIAHLLPYVLPKQSGPNGYIAPFLIRAFYKGLFNCQMGLVTGVSITRGDMMHWTLDGLPCSVDISINIKDLYAILSGSKEGGSQFEIMNNIGLLDYIANMCGININEPDLKRMLTMYYYQKTNAPKRIAGTILNGLDQWATNLVNNAWRRL